MRFSGPYLGFFVCGGKLRLRGQTPQTFTGISRIQTGFLVEHYVRKKNSFPGGGNCPLCPPAMYGPGFSKARQNPLVSDSCVTDTVGIERGHQQERVEQNIIFSLQQTRDWRWKAALLFVFKYRDGNVMDYLGVVSWMFYLVRGSFPIVFRLLLKLLRFRER